MKSSKMRLAFVLIFVQILLTVLCIANVLDSKVNIYENLSELSDYAVNRKININTAGKYELMQLRGIGKVRAARIISYRENNPFETVEEIKNVRGIGNVIYENIKDKITVE